MSKNRKEVIDLAKSILDHVRKNPKDADGLSKAFPAQAPAGGGGNQQPKIPPPPAPKQQAPKAPSPKMPKQPLMHAEPNPDASADEKLGEDVEHLVEDHFHANASAERQEGHKLDVRKDLMEKWEPRFYKKEDDQPCATCGSTQDKGGKCPDCAGVNEDEGMHKTGAPDGAGGITSPAPSMAMSEMSKANRHESAAGMDRKARIQSRDDLSHPMRNSGVHQPWGEKGNKLPGSGKSLAGIAARSGHQWAGQEHRRVLGELKGMPAPKLPKSEMIKEELRSDFKPRFHKAEKCEKCMKSAELCKCMEKANRLEQHLQAKRPLSDKAQVASKQRLRAYLDPRKGADKGVHQPFTAQAAGPGKVKHGRSAMGLAVRGISGAGAPPASNMADARGKAFNVAHDLTHMKAPNLPKSEYDAGSIQKGKK